MIGKLYAGALAGRLLGFGASRHRTARRIRFVHKHPDGRGNRAAAKVMERDRILAEARARAAFRKLQHPGGVCR